MGEVEKRYMHTFIHASTVNQLKDCTTVTTVKTLPYWMGEMEKRYMHTFIHTSTVNWLENCTTVTTVTTVRCYLIGWVRWRRAGEWSGGSDSLPAVWGTVVVSQPQGVCASPALILTNLERWWQQNDSDSIQTPP